MRVFGGAGQADVRLQRSLYVGNLVGKSLNDAKAERTAVDGEIHAIGNINRFEVPCRRLRGLFGLLRSKESARHIALGRNPLIRILLKPGIDRRATILVANRAAKRIVGELPETAPLDPKFTVDDRPLACPRDRRGGVQTAAKLWRPQENFVDAGEIDVGRLHLNRRPRFPEPPLRDNLLIAADETDLVDRY